MAQRIDFWISPHYRLSEFDQPLSIDDKILIFKDRVFGWKLNIADCIINGGTSLSNDGKLINIQKIPHSGYAVLDIIFSYFEMIGKYVDGYDQSGRSKHYCQIGLERVFPALFTQRKGSFENQEIVVKGHGIYVTDYIVKIIYESIRCGLYHSGIASGPVVLSSEFQTPLAFDPYKGLLYINPHKFVKTLINDFEKYIDELSNPANKQLRDNFLRRFDYQDSNQ